MDTFKHLAHIVYRFIILWIVDVISLLATAWILPGISINPGRFEACPRGGSGCGAPVRNRQSAGKTIALAADTAVGLFCHVRGWFCDQCESCCGSQPVCCWALRYLAGGQLFLEAFSWQLVNTIITTFLTIDDDDSFYEGLVERLAMRQAVQDSEDDKLGLVMLEIDGLSYWHIEKAIEEGWMPTLKEMIEQEGYKISRFDCGTPATTPACQAGILLGNNHDIPAFRWFDKDQNRLMVGNNVAEEIEPQLSNGLGLVRDGSSIGNMFSGDAKKSILTFSKLRTGSEEDKKNRADDIYLLMINPYFFMRTLVLFFADVIQELWQAWRQKRQDVQPRINRLAQRISFPARCHERLPARCLSLPDYPGHYPRRPGDLYYLCRL